MIGVGYNGATNHIFVSRALSHTVVVLDAVSGNVLSTLPSGNFGIAVNEANNLVAVCERGQTIDGDPPAPGRLHILRDGSSAPLQVTIELHPSVIQLGSKGVVSATILSTPSFDATTIVPSSVRLGAAPAIRSHIDDANADGRADLVIQDGSSCKTERGHPARTCQASRLAHMQSRRARRAATADETSALLGLPITTRRRYGARSDREHRGRTIDRRPRGRHHEEIDRALTSSSFSPKIGGGSTPTIDRYMYSCPR